MRSILWRWRHVGVGALLFMTGTVLHPASFALDVLLDVSEYVGLVFLFAALVWMTCSWGRIVSRWLLHEDASFASSLALGSAVISLQMVIFGSFGLIGEKWRILHAIVWWAGLVIDDLMSEGGRAPWASLRRRKFSWKSLSKIMREEWISIVLTLLLIISVGYWGLHAFLPDFHSDPLWDHLFAPALWWQEGVVRHFFTHPLALKAASWEYLHLASFSLVGMSGGHGLLDGHALGQWWHWAVGFVGSVLLTFWIAGLLTSSKPARLLAAIAVSMSGAMAWTAMLAKDDWGVALWLLMGFGLWVSDRMSGKSTRVRFVSGLMMGYAIGGKFTVGFLVLGLLVETWIAREKKKRMAVFLSGLTLGAAPILIRNIVETGNPVFPLLSKIFGAPGVADFERGMVQMYGGRPLQFLKEAPLDLVRFVWHAEPYFLFFLIVAGVSFFVLKKKDRVPGLIGTLIGFLIFICVVGRDPRDPMNALTLRLFGPGWIVGTILGIVQAVKIAELKLRAAQARKWIPIAALSMALLSFAVGDWRNPFRDFAAMIPRIPAAIIQVPTGGEAKAWLRKFAAPDVQPWRILSTGDEQLYYVSHLPIQVMSYAANVEAWTKTVAPDEYADLFCSLGVAYVLNTFHWNTRHWNWIAFEVDRLAYRYPEAVVFLRDDAFVLDLRRIVESRDRQTANCGTQSEKLFLPPSASTDEP